MVGKYKYDTMVSFIHVERNHLNRCKISDYGNYTSNFNRTHSYFSIILYISFSNFSREKLLLNRTKFNCLR